MRKGGASLALASFVSIALLTSCGGSDGTPAPSVNADELDVRVAVPAPDPSYVDFIGPEMVVAPGSERMFCLWTHYDGPDTAFFDQQAMQGKFGHHAILLEAPVAKPDGTVEDCTDMGSLKGFQPFSLPFELPAGVGVYLPHGKPVVFQFHYVNTGKKPIRVRDVARLKKRDLSEVKTFAAVWAANASKFQIGPRSPATKTLDCTLDRDMDLLFVGGHMHEYGAAFKVELGTSDADMKTIYSVDAWKPEFRDLPPVELHTTDPIHVAKGQIFRTTCSWMNATDQPLAFPSEMCTSFGYVTGSKLSFTCQDGEIQNVTQP